MNPTAKGTLWAVGAAVSLSWLPLFFLYTHTGNDPFVWRSWLILFQSGVLGLALIVMPAKDKNWKAKIRRFLFYWGDGGEPVRVRNLLEVLKTPAFWMVIGFAVDLTFWVWAATLIDPLVATLVFQLFPLGMVWMAARLGRKISAGQGTAPHVIGGRHWALMATSFLGAALVIWSETGTVRTLNWLGIALALAATAFGIGSFWGTVSTGRLMTWPDDDPNDLVWAASLSAVVGRFFALPLTLLGSVIFFPSTDDHFDLTWTTLGFLSVIGVFNMAGAVSHRYSLYVTSKLSVQRIMFFSPPLQMLWLWMFTDVSIAKPRFLLIGTAIVLLSNLGYQTKPD